jgi:hypothetical protein
VITQETGFPEWLEIGCGVLAVATLDEAIAPVLSTRVGAAEDLVIMESLGSFAAAVTTTRYERRWPTSSETFAANGPSLSVAVYYQIGECDPVGNVEHLLTERHVLEHGTLCVAETGALCVAPGFFTLPTLNFAPDWRIFAARDRSGRISRDAASVSSRNSAALGPAGR